MTVYTPKRPVAVARASASNSVIAPFRRKASSDLWVGERPLSDAVRIAGGTPTYLHDRPIMARRVADLRAAMPPSLKLLYSIKANPHPHVVSAVAPLVDGFDVASAGELCLAIGVVSADGIIQFSGPGKTQQDLERAVVAGVVINVESITQVSAIAAVARATGYQPKLSLRINPSFLPGGAGLRMTGRPSQFGIFSDDVPEIVAAIRAEGMELMGLHFYWGTQMLSGATIGDIERLSWHSARDWITELDLRIERLNLGGGFGVPYFADDVAVDITPVAAALDEVIQEFAVLCPAGEVQIELGRYLAAPAGLYVTRVLDLKRFGDALFAVTDGGMHNHLAATGNLGQGLHRPYPIVIDGKLDAPAAESVTVTGCLCTPLDTFARDLMLPDLAIDDLVVVLQSGAYGASASPAGFLSHAPANYLVL